MNKWKLSIYTIFIFIILNTLKTVLFNYFILPEKAMSVFTYKIFTVLAVNIILFSALFRLKSRLPFIAFYIIQAAYIFAYLSYYAYFGNYLHLFQAAALFTEGVGQIARFTIPVSLNMLVILIDLPVFLILSVNYSNVAGLLKPFKKPGAIPIYISLLAILLTEIWNYGNSLSIVQLSRKFYASEPKIIEKYGTFINNIVDLTVNYGGENMIQQFKYGKTVSYSPETADPSNIVIIQIEAMDSSIISEKYNGEYITPFLHSVSEKGIYYPYVLSYHKSGGTSDCEFSILNSIEPLGNYPSIKISKYDYPNSLIKALKACDYSTMAFHGNMGSYYNRDAAFSKMGFDIFYDIESMGLEEKGWGAPDHEVFNFALDKMQEQHGKPFLSHIITMSSHMPFKNTSGYYNNNRYDTIKDETVRNYFTAMSYVDRSVQDFVLEVKARFPGTYILIFGDHSPGIESEYYRQSSYMSGGDYFEFVPFIMLTPDNSSYRENRYAASFLDISPTILYAAGIDFTIKTDGINLAEPPDVLPQIPFKGKLFDREYLFTSVRQHVR